MGNKFRKKVKPELMAQIRAVKTESLDKGDEVIHSEEQQLSETDKLVWAYKKNEDSSKSVVKEIVTVSFVTKINKEDYTVIHYDSTHDKILHMHIYQSIDEPTKNTVIPLPIRKKGNQAKLLSWAIKDIRKNWNIYRRKFYKRSGLKPDF